MKISIVRADPAGNISVLVTNEVRENLRAAVSSFILKNRIAGAEQVGFLTKPRYGADFRLAMAGDEFSGNAIRAAGLFWAKTHGLKGRQELEAEISGAKWPMTLTVDTETGFSSAELPLPSLMEGRELYGYRFAPVVSEGIVHLICDLPREEIPQIKEIMSDACRIYRREACGIVFLDPYELRITPATYLSKTDFLVFEGSCASGTAAAVCALSGRIRDGFHTLPVKQPCGVLSSMIEKRNGQLVSVSIGGKITLDEECSLEIPDSLL